MPNLNNATELTDEVIDQIEEMMGPQPWTREEQFKVGAALSKQLVDAIATIILRVPPCADRSTAIRKIREARMDCNSAITHGGKYWLISLPASSAPTASNAQSQQRGGKY